MQDIKAEILLKGCGTRPPQTVVTSVVTDSRQVKPGCVFVCIKGERTDGHSYALSALQGGAGLIVAEHEIANIHEDKIVRVENSLDAMIQMGANYRAAFSPLLVGVTGSVGKTTTKEFCYAVFSQFGNTLKTEGNQNNEIGMPNTLFRLTNGTRFAVVEMGMQGLGEIHKLTMAARPAGAIITGIGVSHLQQLKTRENILKAKLEICDGIEDNGVLVTPYEDSLLANASIPSRLQRYTFGFSARADVYATDIAQNEGSCSFILHDAVNGSIKAVIPAIGRHNVLNALAAYTLATRLGLCAQKAAQALVNFKTTGHRQNIVQYKGVSVIEDCYNANPDSMRAALSTLRDYTAKRRIAVLGDMFELGEYEQEAHFQIGEFAAKNNADYIITVGEAAKSINDAACKSGISATHFESKAEAVKELACFIKQGDVVLVKASHGMHFEEILEQLYKMK